MASVAPVCMQLAMSPAGRSGCCLASPLTTLVLLLQHTNQSCCVSERPPCAPAGNGNASKPIPWLGCGVSGAPPAPYLKVAAPGSTAAVSCATSDASRGGSQGAAAQAGQAAMCCATSRGMLQVGPSDSTRQGTAPASPPAAGCAVETITHRHTHMLRATRSAAAAQSSSAFIQLQSSTTHDVQPPHLTCCQCCQVHAQPLPPQRQHMQRPVALPPQRAHLCAAACGVVLWPCVADDGQQAAQGGRCCQGFGHLPAAMKIPWWK